MAVAFMALNRKLNPRLIWTHAIDGDELPVALRKAPLTLSRSEERKATLHLSLYQSALHVYISEAITLVAITFVSALLVWVRRRHQARRNQRSDACYVAISVVQACEESDGVGVANRRRRRASRIQRCSLSRPHTPCVRLERALEGLRKSPLTVDSHTAAGLVVPVAT
ncbi:hypothetical protein Taro_011622 [Colocasia esculenta]|uniref:Uncharacterized protein n=1 Tax=Colocasia esculenta TaxID=4460 RepID=A0A843UD53_COLES|nr:hypothetical protein [Colocasia esculenta]